MRIATRNSSDGAIPERNELTVKRTVQIRKNRRRPNRAESQPVAGMTMAFAARNEVMTHDISWIPADIEPCMWGRATLVTLESRTCMTVTIMTENVMAHRRAGEICPSVTGSTELTPTPYVITARRWRPIEPAYSPHWPGSCFLWTWTPGSPRQTDRGPHREVPDAARSPGPG